MIRPIMHTFTDEKNVSLYDREYYKKKKKKKDTTIESLCIFYFVL